MPTTMLLARVFNKGRDAVDGYRDLIPSEDVSSLLDSLETEALRVLYDENEEGGHARRVVAGAARALNVDLNEGIHDQWSPENMARVVSAAQAVADDRDHWRQEAENHGKQAELWKSLAQRQDNTAPLRTGLRTAERERDHWRARFEGAQANAEYVRGQYGHPDEVDELKATVVRQAREITQLKGEGE
jgi:hypothetical protein